MQIALLAVDAYHSFRDAHHPFHAPDRRQTRPFEQGHGVENGFGVKNPAAGVIALAAIEAATPALMGREAQCRKALFPPVAVERLDFARPIFDILEEVCGVAVTSTVAHVNAVNGDAAVRQTLAVPSHEALLLLDEVSFSKLTTPVMYSLSYYTNFFDFALLRKKV